ncbi:hypothetical protein Tco_1455202 [Tanacetum coccineum]
MKERCRHKWEWLIWLRINVMLLVVTEISRTKLEKHDESSRLGNDTQAEGVDIRHSNDTKPLNEDAEQFLDKRHLLAFVIENKTAESLNQTLESENDFQSSRVETSQCDEVKIKFDKVETQNIELEHQVDSLLKDEHLKLVYKNLFDSIKKSRVQTQSSKVTQNEEENLRSKLSEFAFDYILGKDDSSPSSIAQSNISELEKESGENIYFDDVKLELSNRTAKFEAYFEKLENMKVVLERQLTRKIDDPKAEKGQILKEINHLRIQLENLKGKSVETNPKVVVQKDLSKPVTAQSLPKNEKDQL